MYLSSFPISGSRPTSDSPSATGPACALDFIEWKVAANIGRPFPRVHSMFCKERQRQPIETKRHATCMHRGAILRAQLPCDGKMIQMVVEAHAGGWFFLGSYRDPKFEFQCLLELAHGGQPAS